METGIPEKAGMSSERLARIGPLWQDLIETGHAPGIVSLLARRGKLIHCICQGVRDTETGAVMTADTIVRMYSMSKPLIAVAVMILQEDGRLTLGQPASDFLPALSKVRVWAGEAASSSKWVDAEQPITIQHLLTHTSGVAYGSRPGEPVDDLYIEAGLLDDVFGLTMPLAELAARLAALPLAHQPGATFRYGMNYELLGQLVQVVADQPLGDFVQARICDPLGMVDTGFYVPADKLDRLAGLYDFTKPGESRTLDSPTATSPFADPHRPASGGGGVVSTASDWLRFCQMMLNGGVLNEVRLLSTRTVARMTTNHVLMSQVPPLNAPGALPAGQGYGLGFGVVVDGTQQPYIHPTGSFSWLGYGGARFWVDPHEELISICLCSAIAPSVWHARMLVQNMIYAAIMD